MWRAASALFGLVAAIDHVPLPRTGLWAPHATPTVLPLHAHGSDARRPSLWSTKYEPPFQAKEFNPAEARFLDQKEFRVPPALKKPLLAATKAAHPKAPPVPPLVHKEPPMAKPSPHALALAKEFDTPSVLWTPPKANPLPPLALAKEFDTPSQFNDGLSERFDREEEHEADDEASNEALEASDPILAKLDNIAAALHAMHHPSEAREQQPRLGGPQLGVAQLHQHVFTAPLALRAPKAAPKPAPRAAAVAPKAPMLHQGPVAPTPMLHHAPPPAEAAPAPRPELSALRTQASEDGLNRLFGDDAGKPTAPPPVKKKVLALARVVGSVRAVPAVAAPETSLASVYSHPHRA